MAWEFLKVFTILLNFLQIIKETLFKHQMYEHCKRNTIIGNKFMNHLPLENFIHIVNRFEMIKTLDAVKQITVIKGKN